MYSILGRCSPSSARASSSPFGTTERLARTHRRKAHLGWWAAAAGGVTLAASLSISAAYRAAIDAARRRVATGARMIDTAVGPIEYAEWPWFLGVDLIVWLSLFPGLVLVGYFFSRDPVSDLLVYALILSAFGFLLLAIIAGFAHDGRQQPLAP